MKKMLLILLLQVLTPLYALEFGHEQFFRAHEAYDQGLYEEAIKLYPRGISSGELHYNLGNFYFKSGDLGKSIFHYRYAHKFIPRDADLLFNLNYARKKVVDKIESKEPLHETILGLTITSFSESVAVLAIISLIFWPLMIFTIFKKSEWIYWPKLFFGIAFLISFTNVGVSYYKDSIEFGVVTDKLVKVFSGVGKGDVVLFTLHTGVEFKVNEHYKDWVAITLIDGKKGWVKQKHVKVSG